jgi:hypothetical protein
LVPPDLKTPAVRICWQALEWSLLSWAIQTIEDFRVSKMHMIPLPMNRRNFFCALATFVLVYRPSQVWSCSTVSVHDKSRVALAR